MDAMRFLWISYVCSAGWLLSAGISSRSEDGSTGAGNDRVSDAVVVVSGGSIQAVRMFEAG